MYIKTGIYGISCVTTGDIYVGQAGVSFRVRWNQHRYDLRNNKHRNRHLQNAWNKYGEDYFEFSIIEVVEKQQENLKQILAERETYWIQFYKYSPWFDREVYNVGDSSRSTLGIKRSKEFADNCAKRMRGTKLSIEQKNKISVSLKEHNSKESTKIQRSEMMKQTWINKEYASKFQKNYGYVVSPDGIEYQVIGACQFARDHGINKSAFIRMLNGGRPSAQGWRKV